jgi:hypothetical protein
MPRPTPPRGTATQAFASQIRPHPRPSVLCFSCTLRAKTAPSAPFAPYIYESMCPPAYPRGYAILRTAQGWPVSSPACPQTPPPLNQPPRGPQGELPASASLRTAHGPAGTPCSDNRRGKARGAGARPCRSPRRPARTAGPQYSPHSRLASLPARRATGGARLAPCPAPQPAPRHRGRHSAATSEVHHGQKIPHRPPVPFPLVPLC